LEIDQVGGFIVKFDPREVVSDMEVKDYINQKCSRVTYYKFDVCNGMLTHNPTRSDIFVDRKIEELFETK